MHFKVFHSLSQKIKKKSFTGDYGIYL